VFGITLGAPFPDARELGDCPAFAPFRREPHPDEVCVDTRETFSSERIPLANVPFGDIASRAIVRVQAGKVDAIVVPFGTSHLDAMKALLVERYGAPTGEADAASAGLAQALTWQGKRMTIELRPDAVEFRALAGSR
jgi:hypothetical protein